MIIWKKYYSKKKKCLDNNVIHEFSVNKNYINFFNKQTFIICDYLKVYLKNYFISFCYNSLSNSMTQKQVKKTNINESLPIVKKEIHSLINKISKNYIKPILKIIFILKNIKTLFYQSCCYFLFNNKIKKRDFFIFYVIYFNFSISNTNLQIMDSLGNSKIFYSAGLVDLKGKQKVVRKLVLVKLFNILTLLKLKLIKNAPIALHLKNVGSSKFLIVKKLKRKFFIKIIKSFELTAYNGCRKKKERRKRQKKLKKQRWLSG